MYIAISTCISVWMGIGEADENQILFEYPSGNLVVPRTCRWIGDRAFSVADYFLTQTVDRNICEAVKI